jgi:hypothetical protein
MYESSADPCKRAAGTVIPTSVIRSSVPRVLGGRSQYFISAAAKLQHEC